ncbi:hypothetical protein LXA43DRAFT_1038648 [Ganoderma leucocontextum]|nr:hypothetical protein LXA43DRAFT_1038648 [Ganoderma leucocontextum]
MSQLSSDFGLASTTYKNPSNNLKRGRSPDSLSAHPLLAKKTKFPPLPHDTLLRNCHTLQPSLRPSCHYHSNIGISPQEPTTAWAAPPLHHTASLRWQRAPLSSHEIQPTLPSAPTHQVLRPRKHWPPLTDSSGIEDWALVDDALRTQVASAHILPSYAQLPAPWEPDGGMVGQGNRMHIPLTRFADLEKGSKGKERARSGWTAPRWSNVGEFKARLDTMYGPGDINRGLGRRPNNILAGNVESGTAPDQPALVGLRDPEAAQGSTLTEDEDGPEMSLGGMRRGRLENPSP